MKLTNQKIRKILRLVILGMILIALGDLILSQFDGALDKLSTGYLFVVFPVLIALTYAIVGLPYFFFDAEAEVLNIKSHLVFSSLIGKEVYIRKGNVLSMQVDRTGIRKKLHIRYIKNGNEHKETFSVSLLSSQQLVKLMEYANTIEKVAERSEGPALFI